MANLTVSIEESVLKEARMKALDEGTSVNALVRSYLEHYVGDAGRQQRVADALFELADGVEVRHEGPRWTRDSLHEREDA